MRIVQDLLDSNVDRLNAPMHKKARLLPSSSSSSSSFDDGDDDGGDDDDIINDVGYGMV